MPDLKDQMIKKAREKKEKTENIPGDNESSRNRLKWLLLFEPLSMYFVARFPPYRFHKRARNAKKCEILTRNAVDWLILTLGCTKDPCQYC